MDEITELATENQVSCPGFASLAIHQRPSHVRKGKEPVYERVALAKHANEQSRTRVQVQSTSGGKFYLNVQPRSQTLHDLFAMIAEKEGVHVEEQEVILNGAKYVYGDQALQHLDSIGVVHGSLFTLLPRNLDGPARFNYHVVNKVSRVD